MKSIHTIAAAVALCVTGIAPAMAQSTTFTNGNFGTPTASLTAWTTAGDVVVAGSKKVAVMSTASVDFEDDFPLQAGFNNNSGTAAVDFFNAADLGGVPVTSLDIGGYAYEGSAIRQDFYATAGSTLTVSFDWAFLSSDTANPDFGFLAINNSVVNFVDTNSSVLNSQFNGTFGDLNNVTWGWNTASFSYTANANGAVSLVLGVVDIGDMGGTSELRVDNVAVTSAPVPEPETYAMMLAGLGMLGGAVRRRRQGKAA